MTRFLDPDEISGKHRRRRPPRPHPTAIENRHRGADEALRFTLNALLASQEEHPHTRSCPTSTEIRNYILKQIHDLETF